MKTKLYTPIVLLAILSASCKKDYKCVCTTSGTVVSTTIFHATKSTAKSDCDALSSSGNNGKTCSIQ